MFLFSVSFAKLECSFMLGVCADVGSGVVFWQSVL